MKNHLPLQNGLRARIDALKAPAPKPVEQIKPSLSVLTLFEIVSVGAGKKTKEQAFDAIAEIFNVNLRFVP